MKRSLVALWSLLLPACAEDGGGGRESSGVSSAKEISALSREEAQRVCRWLKDSNFELSAEHECKAGAVFRAPTSAVCEQELERCVASELEERDERYPTRHQACDDPEIDADCTATVAQLERCVNDTLTSMRRYAESLSCSRTMPNIDEWQEPASCDGVIAGCFLSD